GRSEGGRRGSVGGVRWGATNGVGAFRARHAVHKISGRPPVRCHGRLWTSSWDGFDPCFAAVVGRQRRRAHAGGGRRRKIRKYEPKDTAGLPRGGLWLVCSSGDRRCIVCVGCCGAASVS